MKKHLSAASSTLVAEIDQALERVDALREELDRPIDADTSLAARRRAHARLGAAFLEADGLLRIATGAAKSHSRREWAHWRHLISRLDTRRQLHLFEESDEPAALPIQTVRAIDTGLSGPAIGDFLHGGCSPAGKPATYGLDLDAVITETAPAVWDAATTARAADVIALPAVSRTVPRPVTADVA